MKILLFCFLFFFLKCVPLAQEGDFKENTTLSTQASVQAPSSTSVEKKDSKEKEEKSAEKKDEEEDEDDTSEETAETAETAEEETEEEELAGEFDYNEFSEEGPVPLTERL